MTCPTSGTCRCCCETRAHTRPSCVSSVTRWASHMGAGSTANGGRVNCLWNFELVWTDHLSESDYCPEMRSFRVTIGCGCRVTCFELLSDFGKGIRPLSGPLWVP